MNNNGKFLIPITHFDKTIMQSAKGSYIQDVEGKRYLDLNSGQFCTVFGHSNDELIEQIAFGTQRLIHTASSILSQSVIECSYELHRISGAMEAYSIFLSTGAEAVEFCIRYAKYIKNKSGIVCFDKGYHGLTLGAQSVTYGGRFANPHIQDIYSFQVPDTYIKEDELKILIDEFEGLLKENNNIAAVLMEPIVSVGGMIIPPKEWFQAVRRLCDKYDTLLIFDECQTGFGRTGSWFAYQSLDVIPDMVALAKGIGQGYPVAVAMFCEKIIPDNGFSMTHYSSHQNDALAANIIASGINYIEKYSLLEKINETGKYFKEKLIQLQQNNPYVKQGRGCGLMLGIDLKFKGVKDYRNIYKGLFETMMAEGVIIQGTNGGKTLRFLPDYLITEEDINFAIDTLHSVLKRKDWCKYEI